MNRNRRNNNDREKMILMLSSAFLLTALTLSGIYLGSYREKQRDRGVQMDYGRIQIGELNQTQGEKDSPENDQMAQGDLENDQMDRAEVAESVQPDPLQENPLLQPIDQIRIPTQSSDVINPGLEMASLAEQDVEMDYMPMERMGGLVEPAPTIIDNDIMSSGLVRPVSGAVILPFSMNHSVYFATLDQYKYNPATLFQASEGFSVLCCSEARVVEIFEDPEIGRAVRLDLGGGYEAVYGQLRDISVAKDQVVYGGEILGTVAQPTKYYNLEGCNLYFALTRDGIPVDPKEMFK